MAKEKATKASGLIAKLPEDRVAAAKQVMAEIEKEYGSGSIVRMGDKVGAKHPVVPTSVYGIDIICIGAGGIPRGKITEVFGPSGGGKSTLCMTAMAEAQKAGGMVAYIDFENCFDANYSSALGVDVDSILISQPQTGEEGIEICEKLVRSNSFDIITIDSVAAAVPRAELEGDPGEAHMGRMAKMWTQGMRKLVGAACRTSTAIVLVNQVRSNMSGYGPAESTPCGKAIPFFSTLRLDVRKVEQIKSGIDTISGQKVKIKSVKNRLSAPYRETVVDLIYGVGFSREGSVLDAAVDNEVVTKAGAWYSFAGERLGQGRDAVISNLRENQTLYNTIYTATVEKDGHA